LENAKLHAVGTGAKNTLGPEHNGLMGRKTGAVAGSQYSPALKNSDFAWDQARWIERETAEGLIKELLDNL